MQNDAIKSGQDDVNSHIQMPKEVIKRFHNQYRNAVAMKMVYVG